MRLNIHSPENSIIDFHLFCGEKAANFLIKDYGIGIPKNDLGRLFESFYRGANLGVIRGSGLGLFIVNNFVDLYGGRIKF